LISQLEDLHQNYSTGKNSRLQAIKSDIEKESNELNKIDPKSWSFSDRQRSTNSWFDLQEKLDDQQVDFIYKPSVRSSHLGEIHLKVVNQDNEHVQLARLQQRQPNLSAFDSFDNQSMFSGRESRTKVRKRMIVTDPNTLLTQSVPFPHEFDDRDRASRAAGYSVKFSSKTDGNAARARSRLDDHQVEQEGNQYAVRKVVRTHQTFHLPLSNQMDQQSQIEDNTPLTPRMPLASVQLHEYSRKATHVLTGPNETDKFLAPKAIAVTDSNHLLIADTKKHRIIVFDLQMKTMRGLKGFLFPDGLCLAGEQCVIITDRHRVSKYDWFNGKMLSFIGSKKEGCTQSSFSWPKGVAIDHNYVYVCDSYNSRMVVLNHHMRYETEWMIIRGRLFQNKNSILSQI